GHVGGHARELSIFPPVYGIEIELLARIFLAQTKRSKGVGEIDRAVALDHDVIRSAEALALVIVGEHGALAVGFDAHERAASEGCEDEAALAVEREAVGADHRELFEPWFVPVVAVILNASPAPDFRSAVANSGEIDRGAAVTRELPDHVARDIGEQE